MNPDTIRVLRSGQPHELRLTPRLGSHFEQLAQSLSICVVSFAWFVVATTVAVLKPDSKIARLAVAAGIAQALVLLRFSLSPTAPFLDGLARIVFYLLIFPCTPLQLALGYHFDRFASAAVLQTELIPAIRLAERSFPRTRSTSTARRSLRNRSRYPRPRRSGTNATGATCVVRSWPVASFSMS